MREVQLKLEDFLTAYVDNKQPKFDYTFKRCYVRVTCLSTWLQPHNNNNQQQQAFEFIHFFFGIFGNGQPLKPSLSGIAGSGNRPFFATLYA